MNTMLEPPAERDLPPGRQAELRTSLLKAVASPDRRPTILATRRRRWVTAAAASVAVAVAAGAATVALYRDDPEVLAYSGGALPPEVRRAADQCLADNLRYNSADTPPELRDARIGVDLTLVNFIGRGNAAVVAYTAKGGMVYCTNHADENSRSIGRSAVSNWLPGPVAIESASTQEIEGTSDEVTLAGRISGRVARLLLDHGNGRATTANLAAGTFTLIADGPVDVAAAMVISYDATGAEIDRRRALTGPTPCYVDPRGAVVPGSDTGTDCRPAEPWR